VEVVFESEMSSEESRMLGSVSRAGTTGAAIQIRGARALAAFAVVALLALGAIGCAPVGLGDPCTPEAIPGGGFSPREVYVESGSVQCRTRTCMVYHLDGNPECRPSCAICAGGSDACPRCTSAMDCVTEGTPSLENSSERVFCSCRCSAGGNPSLPLCQCTAGFRCVPDGDPGGGYCVPNEVAINSTPAICENDSECLTGGVCDPATRHCL
jgi:hypothetical protein